MKVLLAMSGGVDSSLCGYLLQEKGYEVVGATFNTGFSDAEKFKRDVADAKSVADYLGIEHRVIDYSHLFKEEVIDPFIQSYKDGKTPNPCVICNRILKFGTLMDYAMENGFDFLATGHYAKVGEFHGRTLLKKAKDDRKDQTYFMYEADNLEHVIFPLGNFTKDETRALAKKLGIKTSDKKDSQEICFIKTDYRDFLNSQNVDLPSEGYFIDINGNILGRHKGTHNYTIGQRKGLEIALGSRYYVVAIDTKNNTVTLADESQLYKKHVVAKVFNQKNLDILTNKDYEVKTRYTLHGSDAKIKYEDGKLIANFYDGVRAPAIGQAMVIYDGEYVIGGGEIVDAF